MNSKEVIIEFLKEMTEWEVNYDNAARAPTYRSGSGAVRAAVQNEYDNKAAVIFKKYLSDALFDNLGLPMSIGRPPIHLQDVEPTHEESKTKAIVFVTKGNGGMSFPHGRYTLKKINEKWLIDQFHNSWDGIKWIKAKEI